MHAHVALPGMVATFGEGCHTDTAADGAGAAVVAQSQRVGTESQRPLSGAKPLNSQRPGAKPLSRHVALPPAVSCTSPAPPAAQCNASLPSPDTVVKEGLPDELQDELQDDCLGFVTAPAARRGKQVRVPATVNPALQAAVYNCTMEHDRRLLRDIVDRNKEGQGCDSDADGPRSAFAFFRLGVELEHSAHSPERELIELHTGHATTNTDVNAAQPTHHAAELATHTDTTPCTKPLLGFEEGPTPTANSRTRYAPLHPHSPRFRSVRAQGLEGDQTMPTSVVSYSFGQGSSCPSSPREARPAAPGAPVTKCMSAPVMPSNGVGPQSPQNMMLQDAGYMLQPQETSTTHALMLKDVECMLLGYNSSVPSVCPSYTVVKRKLVDEYANQTLEHCAV